MSGVVQIFVIEKKLMECFNPSVATTQLSQKYVYPVTMILICMHGNALYHRGKNEMEHVRR